MKLRRGSLVTMLVTTVTASTLVSALGAASAAPGRGAGLASASASAPNFAMICTSAKRHQFAVWLSEGIDKALTGRVSDVGLKVSDPHLDVTCALHETRHFTAASAIKVTILSALLLAEHGHLTSRQRDLARLMITQSDNAAATALWNEVGIRGMQRFLNSARMPHTVLSDAWGLTQLTAQDELTLLRLLTSPNSVLAGPSRRYVLYLMAHVVPGQRWGVPAGAPADVHVSVKNGWLPDPRTGAWHVNSIGAFTVNGIGYQIVILTSGNPSEDYGIDTIEAAARVINRDISLARG